MVASGRLSAVSSAKRRPAWFTRTAPRSTSGALGTSCPGVARKGVTRKLASRCVAAPASRPRRRPSPVARAPPRNGSGATAGQCSATSPSSPANPPQASSTRPPSAWPAPRRSPRTDTPRTAPESSRTSRSARVAVRTLTCEWRLAARARSALRLAPPRSPGPCRRATEWPAAPCWRNSSTCAPQRPPRRATAGPAWAARPAAGSRPPRGPAAPRPAAASRRTRHCKCRLDGENRAVLWRRLQRGRARWLLRVAVSIGIVTYILVDVDTEDLVRTLASVRPVPLAGALALYLAGQVLSAYKWSLLGRSVGYARPVGEYTRFYFIGMFFNLFGPSTIGGDVVRGLYLAEG